MRRYPTLTNWHLKEGLLHEIFLEGIWLEGESSHPRVLHVISRRGSGRKRPVLETTDGQRFQLGRPNISYDDVRALQRIVRLPIANPACIDDPKWATLSRIDITLQGHALTALFSYQPAEPATWDYPGCPEEVYDIHLFLRDRLVPKWMDELLQPEAPEAIFAAIRQARAEARADQTTNA